ncbi:hypothetical protein B0H14DRAFT_2707382 [Mycena olivaceomarginata]|nr:hypothetical protein B0H14DRAFT_2707382 [Mycena olivaceomarginata]
MSPVARPDLALKHLNIAATLSPEDPEIAFNLAAVLEASKPPLHCPYIYLKRSIFFKRGSWKKPWNNTSAAKIAASR